MPPKSFNANAYGNPRAQPRRRSGATVAESSKSPTTPGGLMSSPESSDQTITSTAITEAHSSSTQNIAKNVKASQSQFPSHSHPTGRSPVQVTQSSGEPRAEPNSSDLHPEQRQAANQNTDPLPKPLHPVGKDRSCANPPIRGSDIAINKLDLDPHDGANGGVSLATIEPNRKALKSSQVKTKIDNDTQLKQLQDLTLKKIQRQGKNRKISDEKHNTTSLRDLDLARTPINPQKPSISSRPWAQGSPVTEGKDGEEYTSRKDMQKTSSQITELPSSRIVDTEMTSKTIPEAVGIAPILSCENLDSTEKREDSLKRSKWASKEELRVEDIETNSNAWGSAAPSDATRGTNPADNEYGQLLNKIPAGLEQETLADWDGRLLPAPADWSDRPRFNNNSAIFKQQFDEWLQSCSEPSDKPRRFNNGITYRIIPPGELEDMKNHADGISMVSRNTTVDIRNADTYGIRVEPDNATKYSKPVEDRDFEDWGKVDPYDQDNAKHHQETTQNLIDNWLAHLAISRARSAELGYKSQNQPLPESTIGDNGEVPQDLVRVRPILNIYLRPATKADLPELTRIYNWHVANTTRPVEIQKVCEADMRARLEMAQNGRLPFLVAGKKNQKGAKLIDYDDGEADLYRQAGLQFKPRKIRGITRIEQLAGFCCLQELTASDFVEHITGEMEIYVDREYMRMGVGKCLIDKMLEIVDIAHIRQTICDFHCDHTIRQNYAPGGMRNLHKVYIVLRKYHTPKAATISIEGGQRVRNNALAKTQMHETDYERWQKPWFEKLGFEAEATLKKAGAKNGRYLDLIYLARETSWCPSEGQVPDPFLGYAGNNGVEDENDDMGY